MALDFRGDPHQELTALLSREHGLGVDGAFVDCPVTAAAWLRHGGHEWAPAAPVFGGKARSMSGRAPAELVASHALALLLGACLVLATRHLWFRRLGNAKRQ
jgi:hypothetical protein